MADNTPHDVEIKEFTMEDYAEAFALWQTAEGISVSVADSAEGVERFLAHNPGLSFVARKNGRLVAVILGGTDGRRGYLHHLAVARDARRRGVGSALVSRCVGALRARGIPRCHLFVENDNHDGLAFWQRLGWRRRDDLTMMSFDTGVG